MNKKDIQLSKSLSWLLRHGAYKEGLPLSTDGYLALDILLQHKFFKGKYDKSDVERVVSDNDKQRFKLRCNSATNTLEIKANQGHSIEIDDSDLIPILDPKYQTVVHGTYYNCWPKIKLEGLSCMKRRHIHLSKGTLDANIVSGIRSKAQIYIFINFAKALADGIKFYESLNGVILTTGNAAGFLTPNYFSKVTDIKTGFPTYTQPQDLEKVFSEYGKVKVDKLTKRYATLSFSNSDEAKTATKHSKKIAVYGEVLCVKPFYTTPTNLTPKKDHHKIKKGRTILSPQEILFSGEFDEQLENVLMAIRLTQEEVQQISELYSDLEQVLQLIWPDCKAIPFGSITTGLGVKCSDADCFIQIPNKQHQPNNNYIMKAKKVLHAHKQIFSDIVPIPNANTPIIKLYHLSSRTHCDLTFKTPLGTRNSHLIDFLLHADPRLLPLAVLVRYWACAHGFTGTRRVTNYALTMMIIFYLQQAPISILPSVQWLQQDPADACLIDGWNAGFMSDYARLPQSTNTSSVAELLGGFFQYYATFDFNELLVCPYLGYPVKKAFFADKSTLPLGFERYKTNVEKALSHTLKFSTPICVQDPFEHSHNVACGISTKVAVDLWTLLNFAASAYEREKINGCRGFLKIILLQKPKAFGIKYVTEYKTNINQREITTIQHPDWKSVIRDATDIIFGQILGFALNKCEVKTIDPLKEKITFTTKATKAVWRRKLSSKMCYLRHSEFIDRQKSLTKEVIKTEKQTFELNFQVEIIFTNEPKKAKICIRYLNGDKDLFREFGRYVNSIINPWFKTLLRPHSRPAAPNDHAVPDHAAPDHAAPDHTAPDHGLPDSDEIDSSDSDSDNAPTSNSVPVDPHHAS